MARQFKDICFISPHLKTNEEKKQSTEEICTAGLWVFQTGALSITKVSQDVRKEKDRKEILFSGQHTQIQQKHIGSHCRGTIHRELHLELQ